MSEERDTSYDEVRYPGHCYPWTHPEHLAALGYIFGLDPRPVEQCRVLEIGCGDGANLIPMAYGLPASEFLGIDCAGIPIAEGLAIVQRLGLKNITLLKTDLLEFSERTGPFDYIIAHGFYSWVVPQAQDRLLQVCRAALSPNGIAFISYNTYPGFYIRQMLREMMMFHVHLAPEPRTKLAQARAFCRLLKDARVQSDELDLLLKDETESLLRHHEGCLYHDDLAEVNRPVYFHEFVEHAGRHGLQYLAEAEYFMMQDAVLAENAREAMRGLEENRLLREQYLDFFRCRRFRQTLLCHQEAPVQSCVLRERIMHLRVSSSASPVSPHVDLHSPAEETFRGMNQSTMICSQPVAKAAMLVLIEAWPRSLAFHELAAGTASRLEEQPPGRLEDWIVEIVLAAYRLGLSELHTFEPHLSLEAGERPVASAVARLQAEKGELLTNLRHRAVCLKDERERRLIRLLDGTRNRSDLARDLGEVEGCTVDLDSLLREFGRLALLL